MRFTFTHEADAAVQTGNKLWCGVVWCGVVLKDTFPGTTRVPPCCTVQHAVHTGQGTQLQLGDLPFSRPNLKWKLSVNLKVQYAAVRGTYWQTLNLIIIIVFSFVYNK